MYFSFGLYIEKFSILALSNIYLNIHLVIYSIVTFWHTLQILAHISLNMSACMSLTRIQYCFTTFFFWCKIYVQWNTHILRVQLLNFNKCVNPCNPKFYQGIEYSVTPENFLKPFPSQFLAPSPQRQPLFWFFFSSQIVTFLRISHKWNHMLHTCVRHCSLRFYIMLLMFI